MGISPSNIVALTFTNKAADEMKLRVSKMVGSQSVTNLILSTFHSLCVRILRRDIHLLGRKKNFTIIDTSDQLGILRSIARDINFDNQKYDLKRISYKISHAKNVMQTPAAYTQEYDDGYELPTKILYEKYEKALVRYNSLDFDDLLVYAIKLFQRHRKCLEKYQNMFKYILVDEYQDTNELQYTLLRLLTKSHHNLFVVGDDDQSIYGWRGARPDNLFRFEKDYPGTTLITLDQNYRSTETILSAANEIIAKNTQRKLKRLWSKKGQGEKIRIFPCEDETVEAETVIEDLVQNQVLKRCAASDIAIFYRTNYQSRILEETLRMRGVPYTLLGGIRFYDRKEVQDIHAYLKLLVNPADDNSLLRIINYPRRGIGDQTVMALDSYATAKQLPLYKSLTSSRNISGLQESALKNINKFVELIEKYRKRVKNPGVSRLLRSFIEDIGLFDELRKDCKSPKEFEHRWDNAQEVLNAVENFEIMGNGGLKDYLDRIALFNEMDNDRIAQLESRDTVKLITLHGAKGLEFPHVYIVGLEEDILPHIRSAEDDVTVQEERRLFYVGITRAQETLTLSYALSRRKYGKQQNRNPSRFLSDLPQNLVTHNSRNDKLSEDEENLIAREYLNRIKEFLK
jgi:DNA helicase-2/ATP-dependent DNA helicase PcrA